MTGVHWSYFIIPHVFAVFIWYKRPELFLRFFSAMALMLGMGLAIYFLIPNESTLAGARADQQPIRRVRLSRDGIGRQGAGRRHL